MTAAELYAARIDAVNAQHDRLRGPSPGDRWSGAARRFRAGPLRDLDPNLSVIASYVEADDVFVDVGGGAGRICLPLARRCKEVIDVDPSPAMKAEFEDSAAEAGIANARFILADWLSAGDVRGDVCLTANVTYFMRDIVRFVEKMEEAASRRVMITVWSVPPPAMDGRLSSSCTTRRI
jgi:SAM-dependent methyltransferase